MAVKNIVEHLSIALQNMIQYSYFFQGCYVLERKRGKETWRSILTQRRIKADVTFKKVFGEHPILVASLSNSIVDVCRKTISEQGEPKQ